MKAKRMINLSLQAFALSITCAHAAVEWHWNADGNGGDGNWGYTPGEKNWNTARENSPASNVTWPDTGEEIANFSTPTATVATIFDEVRLNGLRLSGPELLLNAGTLRFADADSFVDVSTGLLTIDSIIDSEGALTKSGAGTAIFASDSIYTAKTVISAGKLILHGNSASTLFEVAPTAILEINQAQIPSQSDIKNQGTLTLGRDTSVANYHSTGGVLTTGNILNAGTFTSQGMTTINGHIMTDDIQLLDGSLRNHGIIGSSSAVIRMANNTTLVASGEERFAMLTTDAGSLAHWHGDLENYGLIRLGGVNGTAAMIVTDALLLQNNSSMEFDVSSLDSDIVRSASASLAGTLILKENGTLSPFSPVQIIAADNYSGNFSALQEDFDGAVFFNPLDGTVTRLGTAAEFGGTNNQQQVFASLYDDVVAPNTQNVTRGQEGDWNFTSGLIDTNNENLANLLTASLTPNGLNAQVLDRLSPEPYQGLHDYMNQSMKMSALQARHAAPLPKTQSSGKEALGDAREWEFFTSLDTMNGGSSQASNKSSSQLDDSAVTMGALKRVDEDITFSVFTTMHDGEIQGPLMHADASGSELGFVGTYLIDETSRTQVFTGMQLGRFSFDGIRESATGTAGGWLPGDAEFTNVDGTAWRGVLGVESLAYQHGALQVLAHASLHFLSSDVDSIRETGATALLIDGFDQQGQYVDLGLRGTWQVMDRTTAHADLGTSLPLFESSDDIHASFASSGSTMKIQPSALIDQTIYFGLGMRYDLEENLTAGVNWRCETWNHGKPLHNLGAGITWGF